MPRHSLQLHFYVHSPARKYRSKTDFLTLHSLYLRKRKSLPDSGSINIIDNRAVLQHRFLKCNLFILKLALYISVRIIRLNLIKKHIAHLIIGTLIKDFPDCFITFIHVFSAPLSTVIRHLYRKCCTYPGNIPYLFHLTETSKSPASIAKNNKLWGRTCLTLSFIFPKSMPFF